jgi:hypothetical protein
MLMKILFMIEMREKAHVPSTGQAAGGPSLDPVETLADNVLIVNAFRRGTGRKAGGKGPHQN